MGSLLAEMPEVGGLACVRVEDEVARRTETGFLAMIQGMNPRLPRIVV